VTEVRTVRVVVELSAEEADAVVSAAVTVTSLERFREAERAIAALKAATRSARRKG
jgi:hypothetical protein